MDMLVMLFCVQILEEVALSIRDQATLPIP